jgi:hypothetical protein
MRSFCLLPDSTAGPATRRRPYRRLGRPVASQLSGGFVLGGGGRRQLSRTGPRQARSHPGASRNTHQEQAPPGTPHGTTLRTAQKDERARLSRCPHADAIILDRCLSGVYGSWCATDRERPDAVRGRNFHSELAGVFSRCRDISWGVNEPSRSLLLDRALALLRSFKIQEE